VAPPWRRGRSLEKAAKKWGSPFWASSDERVECEAGAPGPTHLELTLNSPPLTWCSPALRVSAGKSGGGGGEWEVSSVQNVVVLSRQDFFAEM
jgi:hypothetical protein